MFKEVKTHAFEMITRSNILGKVSTRWRIKANNGNIIGAASEGYANKSFAEYNALSVAYSILNYYNEPEPEFIPRTLITDSTRLAGTYSVLVNGTLRERAYWGSFERRLVFRFGDTSQYGFKDDIITHVVE